MVRRATIRYLKQTLRRLHPTLLRKGDGYSRADFNADLLAGVTVAVIQVPQSMALALIAGLPAAYGLYASLPGCIANIWGSSRQLSTGPVAITSFLTLAALVSIANPGSPDYIRLAAALAFMIGAAYSVIGFSRLGFLLSLVPSSVVAGFSTAAAAIIVVSQLPNLTGIPAHQHEYVLQSARDILLGLPHISVITCGVGIVSLTMLFYGKRLPKTFPSALIVLIAGIAVGFVLELHIHGVSLVGAMPQSLPVFRLPAISFDEFLILLPKAGIIALVSYVGAHASAKTAARRVREKLDTDQELIGQGFANLATSFFQGFPLSGSFTRTAVNIEAGARTGISAIVASVVTGMALLFFAPLFYFLPKTVLAAIVIISAIPLINLKRLNELYRLSKVDGSIAYLTAGIAFIAKPDDAIFIGVIVALMLFIRRKAWGARVHELGIDARWNVLRGRWNEDDEIFTLPNTIILRIDQPLFYANAQHILQLIDKRIAMHELNAQLPVRVLIIDMSMVDYIDAAAIETLEEYAESLPGRNILCTMIYVRRPVSLTLGRSPALHDIPILHNIAEMKKFAATTR